MPIRAIIFPNLVIPIPTADQALPRIDKFGQPLSTPPHFLSPRRILTAAQQALIYALPQKPDVQADAWWRPLNEPPKPKISLRADLQQHFAYEALRPTPDVTLDEWFNPLSEPNSYKEPRRLATANQPYLAYFNVTPVFLPHTQIGWFSPLSEPPEWKRGPRRLQPGLQPSLVMVLHYPRLPVTYLEGYSLTVELVGLDGRTVYLEDYKVDSDLS